MEIRRAAPSDLEAIQRIQDASPEAVRWHPASYLEHDCWVAEERGPAGFLVTRQVAPGEFEILNLAVDPQYRRCGIGEALLRVALAARPGTWFLEVRDSNLAARHLYAKLGFQFAGRRPQYYEDPPEDAVVMKLQSC